MEIRVRRRGSPVWEDIDAAPPQDRDIAKRILWQPYNIESSLGEWWWWWDAKPSNQKMVLINEEA
jgi:hypothetical protein